MFIFDIYLYFNLCIIFINLTFKFQYFKNNELDYWTRFDPVEPY